MATIYEEIERLKRKIEEDQKDKLKIALFGQPGAGKSALINSIVGKQVAKSGASTDVTKEAQVIEHEAIVFVDLPGYGTSKFPPNDWFNEFNPEQFDLFLCVFSGKFHEADTKFFKQLSENGRTCLFVRTKSDEIWGEGKETWELKEEIKQDVQKQIGSAQKVFFVSNKTKEGLGDLVDGIKYSLEPAKRNKYNRSAKAFTIDHLKQKKEACEKIVYTYSALAAANGLNPIPGLNTGVDLGVMMKLFADIRESYGLTDTKLFNVQGALFPLAKNVLDFATKEGIMLLLKNVAGKEIVRQVEGVIPIVGQVLAAVTGFGMTLAAGQSYLNDCHKLAEKLLEEELAVKS